MRDQLRTQLTSDAAQRRYATHRYAIPALHRYPTIASLISALEDRASIGHKNQDRLLRLLVIQVQRSSDAPLWQQIMLHGFLPGLIRVRASTVSREESGELDSLLWTLFLEVVHTYPIYRRQGSVAAGILLDTRKRFFCVLKKRCTANEYTEAFLLYAEGFGEFRLADHMVVDGPRWTTDELASARRVLRRAQLSPADVDLLVETDLGACTVRQFMQERDLATGDESTDTRMQHRLWQRRRRARGRLHDFLRKARPVR
ncbi:MAG: hypothetical protein MJE77_25865 [Proteobacteria bacterium]|nr:hypothetical protein [Pseudomonadota bacterium]